MTVFLQTPAFHNATALRCVQTQTIVYSNFDRLHHFDQQTIAAFGQLDAHKSLQQRVIARYVVQHTAGTNLMCLLFALEISLAGIHPVGNATTVNTPTYNLLNAARHSAEYDAIVAAKVAAGNISVTQSRDIYYADNNLAVEAGQTILDVLSPIMDVNYQLAVMQWDTRGQLFNINLLRPTRLPTPLDPNPPAPTVVWIHHAWHHFSGFAPNGAWPINRTPRHQTAIDNTFKGVTASSTVTVSTRTKGTSVYDYGGSVHDAPPANTALPFELLKGITDAELITFYPNHVLHWPGIAARLVEAGAMPQDITDGINRARTPGSTALKRNTVRAQLIEAVRAYYRNRDWSFGKRPVVPAWLLKNREWEPLEDKKGLEELMPAWDMASVAQHWRNASVDVPDLGQFSRLLDEAAKSPSINDPEKRDSAPNPPAFPADWVMAIPYHVVKLTESANAIAKTSNRASIALPEYNPAEEVRIPDARRDDAEYIVRNHATALDGETLLRLLISTGGAMAVGQLKRLINTHRGSMSSLRLPNVERPTISKRIAASLDRRATANVQARVKSGVVTVQPGDKATMKRLINDEAEAVKNHFNEVEKTNPRKRPQPKQSGMGVSDTPPSKSQKQSRVSSPSSTQTQFTASVRSPPLPPTYAPSSLAIASASRTSPLPVTPAGYVPARTYGTHGLRGRIPDLSIDPRLLADLRVGIGAFLLQKDDDGGQVNVAYVEGGQDGGTQDDGGQSDGVLAVGNQDFDNQDDQDQDVGAQAEVDHADGEQDTSVQDSGDTGEQDFAEQDSSVQDDDAQGHDVQDVGDQDVGNQHPSDQADSDKDSSKQDASDGGFFDQDDHAQDDKAQAAAQGDDALDDDQVAANLFRRHDFKSPSPERYFPFL